MPPRIHLLLSLPFISPLEIHRNKLAILLNHHRHFLYSLQSASTEEKLICCYPFSSLLRLSFPPHVPFKNQVKSIEACCHFLSRCYRRHSLSPFSSYRTVCSEAKYPASIAISTSLSPSLPKIKSKNIKVSPCVSLFLYCVFSTAASSPVQSSVAAEASFAFI